MEIKGPENQEIFETVYHRQIIEEQLSVTKTRSFLSSRPFHSSINVYKFQPASTRAIRSPIIMVMYTVGLMLKIQYPRLLFMRQQT